MKHSEWHNPSPTFSVEFDRSVARARLKGNERLAAHLEKLRPHLNLQTNDTGEVYAAVARAFSLQLIEVSKELRADPFDIVLILSGVCSHIVNSFRDQGIEFAPMMHTLVKALEAITVRIEAATDGG